MRLTVSSLAALLVCTAMWIPRAGATGGFLGASDEARAGFDPGVELHYGNFEIHQIGGPFHKFSGQMLGAQGQLHLTTGLSVVFGNDLMDGERTTTTARTDLGTDFSQQDHSGLKAVLWGGSFRLHLLFFRKEIRRLFDPFVEAGVMGTSVRIENRTVLTGNGIRTEAFVRDTQWDVGYFGALGMQVAVHSRVMLQAVLRYDYLVVEMPRSNLPPTLDMEGARLLGGIRYRFR
ncbi:MAG: hypothetical protein HYV63_15640 [Candidatus Schekmanbacteria bacterium]|nr:hypothetical protein [Candidatus Schekmanbacteria bacterium]